MTVSEIIGAQNDASLESEASENASTNENSEQFPTQATHAGPKLIEEYIREDPSDVDLSGLRIFSLDEVNDALDRVGSEVHTLTLKKNLIHDLTELPDHVASTLRTLDLYDNKIRRIVNVGNLKNLVKLDLSYNQIEHLEGLEELTNLEELYLVENRIGHIKGLESLKKLRILELGGNRIRKVSSESLRNLVSLRELYLGKNKITCVGDLSILPALNTLSLQANRLRAIPLETFANCTSIKQIYLAENGIQSIDSAPLQNLTQLKVLDLSMNPISSLKGIEQIGKETLLEFWCTSASISSFEEVQRLAAHTQLETVFFEQNPIQQKETRYAWRIAAVLPQVKAIDLSPVPGR